MIDVSTFGPKDAKIIKDNPGKTPYELQDLGITGKAFDRLLAGDYTEIDESGSVPRNPEIKEENSSVVKPASVKKVESKVQLTSPKQYAKQSISGKTGQVQVLNRRTGKVVKVSANAAQRLMKNPTVYQLV